MTGSDTLVFRTARWKTALATAASLIFVMAGLWALHAPAEEFRRPEVMVRGVAILSIVLFGGFAVIGFAKTMQPDLLILDRTGFRIQGVFSRPRIPWTDVAAFTMIQVRGRDFLAWELKPEARHRYRAPLWRIGDSDGHLPSALEKPQDEVLRALTNWRRTYG